MTQAAIDFLAPPPPRRFGVVLLLTAAAILAAVLWIARVWEHEEEAAHAADQRALELRRLQSVQAAAPAPSADSKRWDQARLELAAPWLSALRAIEQATVNPVFLLSLDIEPATGTVKVVGEAPSFDHALAYVQVLDLDGALQPAQLTSHEKIVDPSGRSIVRFSAVTTWSSP